MKQDQTHEAVGFGGAFVRQFKFLWMSRRPLLLAVAVLAVLVLAGEPWTSDSKMRLLTVWPIWLVIVPIFWAFAVFHNEGPDDRFYFWSLPATRWHQTLARVAAGLAWLWVVYAALILGGGVFGLIDGDAWQLAEIGLAGWVNYFSGPLLTYLVICMLTIPSNYPIRWFFGLIFLVPLIISIMDEWLELEDAIETVFQPLINETWGLGVAMIGGLGTEISQLEHTLRRMANPAYEGTTQFDVGTWWTVTPLWMLLFVAIVAFIATRHPDTLPKLRWLRLRR